MNRWRQVVQRFGPTSQRSVLCNTRSLAGDPVPNFYSFQRERQSIWLSINRHNKNESPNEGQSDEMGGHTKIMMPSISSFHVSTSALSWLSASAT